MALIGRDTQLALVRRAITRSHGVVVCGPAGVGKSALAAEAAGRLPQPPLARIVATAAGRSVPFGALAPILDDAVAGGHATAVAAAITRRFSGAARPPLLLVDDLQEIDEPSASVLLSLVANGSIRLLGTLRNGTTPPDAVTALWKEGLVARIDLPPLTRSQVAELLTTLLDGPVASPTVEVLYELSSGNALHLVELARYGRRQRRFIRRSGLWWWTGEHDVPPRLAELLLSRVRALSAAGQAAAEVLSLGDPLPYETLEKVTETGALDELERAGLVTIGEEPGGVLRVRFAHPLLQSVTEASLTTARRRSLSERLRAAPTEHVDIVRQAGWELACGSQPRTDILLAAADAVMLSDSALAERMAQRAVETGAGPVGLATLSHILSERGSVSAARTALAEAATQVTDDEQRFAVDSEDLSQQLWSMRDVGGAAEVIERMRTGLPPGYAPQIDALEALALLYSGRTNEAIEFAQRVVDDEPGGSVEIRALSALVGGLCFADRGPAALAIADRLDRATARAVLNSTRRGHIQALLAITRLLHGQHRPAPPRPTGAFGRWPVAATIELSADHSTDSTAGDDGSGWPLLVGIGRHFAGDLEGAVAPLQEAVVQQLAGEGVFRSEAIAELIVVLSELGRRDEAQAVLDRTPPDGVAIVPGLAEWARAAVAGANWLRAEATSLAIEAAGAAARHGAVLMAWSFVTDAGRWGDSKRAAQALDDLGLTPGSPAAEARAADVRARASGDPAALAAAAKQQVGVGYLRHAAELAALARAGGGNRDVIRTVAAVEAGLERATVPGTGGGRPVRHVQLTDRESEVAHLAADGRSDKEIAALLTVSIRTVQSHLAASYRKLGVSSRADLEPLLPGPVGR
ncbi:MAG: LuxR C-terminal-related transcriptional regulator [Microlunatus sp.]